MPVLQDAPPLTPRIGRCSVSLTVVSNSSSHRMRIIRSQEQQRTQRQDQQPRQERHKPQLQWQSRHDENACLVSIVAGWQCPPIRCSHPSEVRRCLLCTGPLPGNCCHTCGEAQRNVPSSIVVAGAAVAVAATVVAASSLKPRS